LPPRRGRSSNITRLPECPGRDGGCSMRDEYKFIIIGGIAGAAIYFTRSIASPLLFPDQSPWEWVGNELPIYVIVAVLAVAASRILKRHRAVVRATKRLQCESDIRDRISRTFLLAPEENVYGDVLDQIIKFTGSKHGVLGHLDQRGRLVCPSLADHPWELFQAEDTGMVFRRHTWTGLWGRALTERRLAWSNRCTTTQGGAAGVNRAIAVPITYERRVIGLLMVGEKPTDYSLADRVLIQHIADHIGPILNRKLETEASDWGEQAGADRQQAQIQILHQQRLEATAAATSEVAAQLSRCVSAVGTKVASTVKESRGRALLRDLRRVYEIGLKAVNLTRQLLLLSRKHVIRPVTLDLTVVMHRLLKMMGDLLGDDVEVTADLKSDLWSVQADRSAIEQVIMELVMNALAAMPAGGHLRIETQNVAIGEGEYQLMEEARPGNFVCISVTDDGRGMDRNKLKTVFEPFSAAGDEESGPAVGLSVARSIVGQHEGWINAYSEPGRGSTFKIYLPGLAIAPRLGREGPVPIDAVKGHGERVLLVEDEDEICELVALLLAENGYAVTSAASANEAIGIFRRENGAFDLLFSDIALPDEDGVSLANRLTQIKPDLPVLLTSGYMDAEGQWRIRCDKGYDFVSKPFSAAAMLKEVSGAIARARSADEVMT
jgi:signal transduction histidine kinase/ActR/RegA family two-component response regulator